MIVTGANGSGKSAYGKQVGGEVLVPLKKGGSHRFYGADRELCPGRSREDWDL